MILQRANDPETRPIAVSGGEPVFGFHMHHLQAPPALDIMTARRLEAAPDIDMALPTLSATQIFFAFRWAAIVEAQESLPEHLAAMETDKM